jgi:hypothetical protein
MMGNRMSIMLAPSGKPPAPAKPKSEQAPGE